jgi:hypothetical protein
LATLLLYTLPFPSVEVFLCSPKSVAINGDAIAAGGSAPRAIHY